MSLRCEGVRCEGVRCEGMRVRCENAKGFCVCRCEV